MAGFTGRLCEININDCASNPCPRNGQCVDLINSYVCHCKPGFTGANCSTKIDLCESKPCLNNATCVTENGKIIFLFVFDINEE